MERLGVSYFPLYPLQMILHPKMYKQFIYVKPRILKPLRSLEILLYRIFPQSSA